MPIATNKSSFLKKIQEKKAEIDLRQKKLDFQKVAKKWVTVEFVTLVERVQSLVDRSAIPCGFQHVSGAAVFRVSAPSADPSVELEVSIGSDQDSWFTRAHYNSRHLHRAGEEPISITFIAGLSDQGQPIWETTVDEEVAQLTTEALAEHVLCELVDHID